MKKSEEFVDLFAKFGSLGSIDNETSEQLEKFVCYITSVDKVRKEMFMKKYEKTGKAIDLSVHRIYIYMQSDLRCKYLQESRSNKYGFRRSNAMDGMMCVNQPGQQIIIQMI